MNPYESPQNTNSIQPPKAKVKWFSELVPFLIGLPLGWCAVALYAIPGTDFGPDPIIEESPEVLIRCIVLLGTLCGIVIALFVSFFVAFFRVKEGDNANCE